MQSLYAKIIGEGKPLIILHGFLGMSDNWKTLGKKFAENGFEVHLVDQRNHGRSFHSEDFNYDILADDLKNYLHEHQLPHHQSIIDGLNSLNFDVIDSRKAADEALALEIPNWSTRQFLLKNLHWIEKGKLAFRFNLPILSLKMGEVGENIGATNLYEGPSLFLKGDRSEYIIDADITQIKKHFPMATIETISNAGHWLHAENPTQFLDKSLRFLNT